MPTREAAREFGERLAATHDAEFVAAIGADALRLGVSEVPA